MIMTVSAMLAAIAGAISAQHATASLRGTVVDPQDVLLPGVTVIVRNQETGTVRETTTMMDGTYFAGGLGPGTYELRASLSGFRQYVRPDVRLEVGRTTTIDLRLEVGRIDEEVMVVGDTPLLDVTSNQIARHVTSRELTELPVISRSFIGFIALLPGIVPNFAGDSFGSDSVSVNATDPRNNNFLVDGVNNNDDFIGQRAGTQARPPIEAIQEFQVVTHQFDAEFGRTSGAVVNAITKQGTNAFHGSAFSFLQDASLTARDFFTRQNGLPKPDTSQQQFGGTIGGPIVRDKAHFFGSLEHVRLNRATRVNIPSRAELNAATTTAGRVWNTLIRIDHQLNSAHTWGARWLRESSPQSNLLVPVGGRQVTLEASREEFDVDQTAVATLQSLFGNSRLNTIRVAFTGENVALANPGFNANGRRQDLLPPTLQYLTFIDQQSDVAQARVNNSYSFDETLTWFIPRSRGNHDVKIGMQYQYGMVDSTNQATRNGLFEFRSDVPFNAANPATYPERLQVRVPGPGDLYMKSHLGSAFAQDKWRLGERLTLNVGVRYEIEVIPIREKDNLAFPDPERYPIDTNNVAPRLGFAYSLDDANRSVVRGGYGHFYDRMHFELISPVVTSGRFSDSFVAFFPANTVDAGPSRSELPSEPLLRDGPTVNPDVLRQMFPAGTQIRNTGVVYFDNPQRRVPHTRQLTAGYERQIGAALTVSADYARTLGRGLLMTRDLNPGLRADTSRIGAVTRVDPEFNMSVLEYVNLGKTTYDALELHMDKRLSRHFSAKVSYTLAYSRGNTSANGIPQILPQRLGSLNLEANEGPTDFDRRHNFVASGTAQIPHAGGLAVSAVVRAMTGQPFTLIDSDIDADRNAILFDRLPPGTYSGLGRNAVSVKYNGTRNGAYGPGAFQLDLRLGWQQPIGTNRRLDVFAEIFNVTNHAAFDSPTTMVLGHPVADRRMTDFLVLRMLRTGAVPRTAQLAFRFTF